MNIKDRGYAFLIVDSQKTSIFQEQRALIETLLQEKEENARESSLSEASSLSEHNQRQEVLGSKIENPPKPNPRQTKEFAEVEEYNMLIRRMLREIDFCKSKLEDSRHSRIRKGVLSIHDSETVRFQLTHGYSVLDHIDKSLLVYIQYCCGHTRPLLLFEGYSFDFLLATKTDPRKRQQLVLLPRAPSTTMFMNQWPTRIHRKAQATTRIPPSRRVIGILPVVHRKDYPVRLARHPTSLISLRTTWQT